jgi:hypothetical protein
LVLVPAAFYNGLDAYDSASANASLAELAGTGATHVQIETAWYVERCSSTDIGPRNYTPSDGAIAAAVAQARKLGLTVLLNTHIEVACKYDQTCEAGCRGRNSIDFGTDKSSWDRWFTSYTAFIVYYAKLCEVAGCGVLTVHVELQEIGAHLPDIGARWASVIGAARAHFSGQLTASCNGSPGVTAGAARNISYWHMLDYIGIDTFPNVQGDPVTALAVRTAFEELLGNLRELSRHTGRKVLFTQVGYPSCRKCGLKNAKSRFTSVDQHCQAQAYTGIMQALLAPDSSDLVAGLYFWNWLPCTHPTKQCQIGVQDNGESPQHKQAQAVVARFFGNRS